LINKFTIFPHHSKIEVQSPKKRDEVLLIFDTELYFPFFELPSSVVGSVFFVFFCFHFFTCGPCGAESPCQHSPKIHHPAVEFLISLCLTCFDIWQVAVVAIPSVSFLVFFSVFVFVSAVVVVVGGVVGLLSWCGERWMWLERHGGVEWWVVERKEQKVGDC
jgi:hypothetical protein